MTHHYSYQSARECFLSLATEVASVETHIHPLLGPDGETAMDIAHIGAVNAHRVLVLSSGTHGVEGYCGSFIQCELLRQGIAERLPAGLRLVMIHGVNPYGFAWQRRVNEDNIDLNRNFIDHAKARNPNIGYEEIAGILEPEQWHDESIQSLWQQIFAAAGRHDDDPGWQGDAITGGQSEPQVQQQ